MEYNLLNYRILLLTESSYGAIFRSSLILLFVSFLLFLLFLFVTMTIDPDHDHSFDCLGSSAFHLAICLP